MKQMLCYFGNPNSNRHEILSYFTKNNYTYFECDDSQLNTTISSLLLNGSKSSDTYTYPFDFVLFAHFTKDEVIEILNDMRKENIALSHKAMLTQNNIDWTLQYLLEEIDEEENFMRSYLLTQKLLKEANRLDFESYTEESFIPYRDAFLKAYLYLKQNKPEKTELDELNEEIIRYRDRLQIK